MPYIYSFEKLHVWHDSRKLVRSLYLLTNKLPSAEKFGLISQVRRAAVSVVSNIAEGSGRTSLKDQARFYQFAFSSLIELLTQLIIANDLDYITEADLINLRADIEMISNKINALRKSCLVNKPTNQHPPPCQP